MTTLISQKGLLPAGLSDVLYPHAEIQAKTIENLLDIFNAIYLIWLVCVFTDDELEWLRFSMFNFFEGGVPLFNGGIACFSIIKTNIINGILLI